MRTFPLLSLLAVVACSPPSRTDLDEDGITADIDCDDYDRNVGGERIWYADVDEDGWGDEADTKTACERPTGYAQRTGDCAPTDNRISPGTNETCNGADDDCDGLIDESLPTDVWFADVDGDGFGDPKSEIEACSGEGSFVANRLDCDDSNDGVRPGALERCDGIDNNCDGRRDEAEAIDATTWYFDSDRDGYGQTARSAVSCASPGDSWAPQDGDCDDLNADRSPGNLEVCDTIDNDCDGLIDLKAEDAATWYKDGDNDGYGDDASALAACVVPEGYVSIGGDCNDKDRTLSPDTVWFADVDGDGFGDPGMTVTSCSDPSGTTAYVVNALDCDDSDSGVSPRGLEVCDGIDNDCDGVADGASSTDATTYYLDFDGDGFGAPDRTGRACSAPPGFTTDSGDCNDDDRTVNPDAPEFCDLQDNDCDGLIDLDDTDVVDLTWYYDGDGDGFGVSTTTIVSCEQPTDYVDRDGDCADDNFDVNPDAIEVCDAGLDNDCDGLVDGADTMFGDGTWYRDLDKDGYGDIDIFVRTCTEPTGYVRNDDDCNDSDVDKWHPADCWSGPRNFTTCGNSGLKGPTLSQCSSTYSGTSLEGEVTAVVGGVQQWVVPFTATFRIEAFGAQAGEYTYTYYGTYKGGKGAQLAGDVELKKGEIIYIAVGQEGSNGYYGGGGGGGSWVMNEDELPLVVAGGGGGVYYYDTAGGCDAGVTEYGGAGTGSTRGGSCALKTSGEGKGGGGTYGAGGGGLDGAGTSDVYGATGGRGWGNLQGGAYTGTYTANGGFGGGGGAYFGGGGGGGYSGGNGGYKGGGGGSFNDGANPTSKAGVQTGHGKVSIDLVTD